MRRRRVALHSVALVTLAGAGLFLGLRSEGVDRGSYAPNFTVYDATGAAVDLAGFGGQKLLVNFWGPWCPPCIREMESLYDLEQRLEGEVRFVYIGINTFYRDDKPLDPAVIASGYRDGLAAFHERLGRAVLVEGDAAKNHIVVDHLLRRSFFDFRGYWQRQFRAHTNERYGIPVTYLIDGRGRIRFVVHTFQDWRAHEDLLRDFAAGASLARYRSRFVIPEELRQGPPEPPEELRQGPPEPPEESP